MNMIGGDDADRLDTLILGKLCLVCNHLFPAGIATSRIYAELLAGNPGVLGITTKATGDQIESVIHAQCDAMDRADEGALTATDHADSYTLAHRGSFLVESQDLAIESRVTAAGKVVERSIGDLDDVLRDKFCSLCGSYRRVLVRALPLDYRPAIVTVSGQ